MCKTQPWAAGPVGLQQLALLPGFDLAELSKRSSSTSSPSARSSRSPTVTRSTATPRTSRSRGCSRGDNDERRALVGDDASAEYGPGLGRLPALRDAVATAGSGEPGRGTVHLDIADRFGNMISATPSGGWLQSSRSYPRSAGRSARARRCSGSRRGLPSSLRPGTRPRTTLCPGLALRDGEPYLAWGTPGGDQQEQWALHVFLRHVDRGMNLPGGDRRARVPHRPSDLVVLPARVRAEVARARVAVRARTSRDLQRRGHDVTVWPAWSAGRVTAVARELTAFCARGESARDAGLRRRSVASRCVEERTRTYTWDDLFALRDRMVGRSGLELMQRSPRAKSAAADRADPRLPSRRGRTWPRLFECEPAEYHYNPIGIVHAGLAMTLMDSAMGLAFVTTLDEPVGWTTLEVKANFTER